MGSSGSSDEIGQNYGRIGNERINELLVQANAELDPVRQREIVNELDGRSGTWGTPCCSTSARRHRHAGERGQLRGASASPDFDYTMIGFIRLSQHDATAAGGRPGVLRPLRHALLTTGLVLAVCVVLAVPR